MFELIGLEVPYNQNILELEIVVDRARPVDIPQAIKYAFGPFRLKTQPTNT